MSTIDPQAINTSIPPDGSGDPDNPINYLPATERNSKVQMQAQFTNAKNDIEALEATAPTVVQKQALDASNSPGSQNAYATIADLGATPGLYVDVSPDNETTTGLIAAAVVETLPGVPDPRTLYFVTQTAVP